MRHGAFSNSLEELAEAMLLIEWVKNYGVLLKSRMTFLNTAEYVGALSDFTGEIGRTAVINASNREIDSVKRILQADLVISSYLSQFNIANQFIKKVAAVNTNLKKVEDILYELTLQKMGGKALMRDPDPSTTEEANVTSTDE